MLNGAVASSVHSPICFSGSLEKAWLAQDILEGCQKFTSHSWCLPGPVKVEGQPSRAV